MRRLRAERLGTGDKDLCGQRGIRRVRDMNHAGGFNSPPELFDFKSFWGLDHGGQQKAWTRFGWPIEK